MDNCQGPCLHHCTAKSNENIKYILIGLCVGVFLGFLLFKYCNTVTITPLEEKK